MISDLPLFWRRRFDLFEIGFAFLFLPLVVSTMDHPPHVGGILLLWLCAAFLVRGVSGLYDQLGTDWKSFRLPWAPVWVVVVAGIGASLGAGHPVRGMVFLILHAVLFSLPMCLLAFTYGPRRFAGSGWMSAWILGVLPAILFAGMHVGTGSWKAVGIAFLLGLVGRRVPLSIATVAHAAVWAAGARWGLW